MGAEILEEGAFNPGNFAAELSAAPTHLAVCSTLWFENDRPNVWEVKLHPGGTGTVPRPYPQLLLDRVEGGRDWRGLSA